MDAIHGLHKGMHRFVAANPEEMEACGNRDIARLRLLFLAVA
jgi:hypothetical protein